MSDSVKLRSLEDALFKQLAFVPQNLESSNLGSILRSSRKYRSIEVVTVLEGLKPGLGNLSTKKQAQRQVNLATFRQFAEASLKQFCPFGEICKIFQKCRSGAIAASIGARPSENFFLLQIGFWLVSDEFVLDHFFGADLSLNQLIAASYADHVIQFSEAASSKLLSAQNKIFKTSSLAEILTSSLAGGGFSNWARLYQLAALISIFSDNSPNYAPISKILPLEASSEQEIEFWLLLDDQNSFKNRHIPETILSRFEFFLNELSPIAFSRANIAIERAAFSVSKRLSWLIKEILPTTSTKNTMTILKSLQRILNHLENQSKILPFWILDVHAQLNSSFLLVDAFLRKSALSSILSILNCQESLDRAFPKRAMDRSSATPMMQLYCRKLASFRSDLRAASSRLELERYLQIFCDSFNFVFQYFLQTNCSKNRSENLKKDVELAILVAIQHVALFEAAKLRNESQKLKSKLNRLKVKLLLQFAPVSDIDDLKKSPNFGKIVEIPESSDFSDSPTPNFEKSKASSNLEALPENSLRSFCREKFKKWTFEEFLKIINSRNDEDDVNLLIEEIDEKIVLAAVSLFHRTHSPELNLIGLLATISDYIWTLSRSSRLFLKEASNFYLLKSDRIILSRVLYHLELLDTPKNRELLLLFEELEKNSCSLDSAVLDAKKDLISECDESFEMLFDHENEDPKSDNLPQIDALFSSVDFEKVEKPLFEDSVPLVFSKADFRKFVSLRAAS